MTASMRGGVNALRCLLHHPKGSALLDARNNMGETALWWACFEGHGAVVEMLLEAGADPTIYRRDGVTPMDTAKEGGHSQCVKLLQVRVVTGHDKKRPSMTDYVIDARLALITQARSLISTYAYDGGALMLLLFGWRQEWERSNLIAKARRLYDARRSLFLLSLHQPPSRRTRGQAKQARLDAIPTCLHQRLQWEREIPKVGYEYGFSRRGT